MPLTRPSPEDWGRLLQFSVVLPAVLYRQLALRVAPAVEVDRPSRGSPRWVDVPMLPGAAPAGLAKGSFWSSVNRHRLNPRAGSYPRWRSPKPAPLMRFSAPRRCIAYVAT